MSRLRGLIGSGCLALGLGFAAPVAAQNQMQMDVLFYGIRVADIALASRDTGAQYSVAGRVRSTGLARVFARVRFEMRAEGGFQSGRPWPATYSEDVDTGRRASTVELRFSRGVPEVVRQSPTPGTDAIAGVDAVRHVDPLSAIWRLVRGGAAGDLCDFTLPVYDGVRRTELWLGAPQNGDGEIHCDGVYRRVAGFSDEDMAERRQFPFSVIYVQANDAWELTEVAANSLLGQIRIVRRD